MGRILIISTILCVLNIGVVFSVLCGDRLCLSGECNNNSCSCSQHYLNCEKTLNATCADVTDYCLNGGTCNKNNNTITCNCSTGTGTVGERCFTDLCSSNPCENSGTCTQNGSDYSCNCNCPWEGTNCSQSRCPDCRTGQGQCTDQCTSTVDPRPPARCDCAIEWSGELCAYDFNECTSTLDGRTHNCVNGTCKNTYGGFECDCHPGFTGGRCDQDINECNDQPCSVNRTENNGCVNFDGGYNCTCKIGYEGKNCTDAVCSDGICENGGACNIVEDDWLCSCQGFYVGSRCTDEGPCVSSPCFNNGSCTQNQINDTNQFDFTCQCVNGWSGDRCDEDVDECKLQTDLCENNSSCVNSNGSYSCDCTSEFSGPSCTEDVDECSNEGICGFGNCTNLQPGFRCTCQQGYAGEFCNDDVNECLSNPCNQGTCTNYNGTYNCTCPPEYSGSLCDIRDYCYDQCSVNNSINCTNKPDGADCVCKPGWLSDDCTMWDQCKPETCSNGGTCKFSVVANSTECVCTEKFTGETCQQSASSAPSYLLEILLPILLFIVVAIIVGVVVCFILARRKRAEGGVYSPSRQEAFGNRLELAFSLKPPPEERLI